MDTRNRCCCHSGFDQLVLDGASGTQQPAGRQYISSNPVECAAFIQLSLSSTVAGSITINEGVSSYCILYAHLRILCKGQRESEPVAQPPIREEVQIFLQPGREADETSIGLNMDWETFCDIRDSLKCGSR